MTAVLKLGRMTRLNQTEPAMPREMFRASVWDGGFPLLTGGR